MEQRIELTASPDPVSWQFQAREASVLAPSGGGFPIELLLDDGTAEGDFGVGDGVNARQFLWFNQFDLTGLGPVDLDEIQVFFPTGPNMAAGNAIQLAIYHDPDSDPTNGADLLSAFDGTIQSVDGTSFSSYPLAMPLSLPEEGSLLVGVVNRFVESGVTSATRPAALDTTASQGRSWLAVWIDDPPALPELPSNSVLALVDDFAPGNWTIRAFGSPTPEIVIDTVEVPTLQPLGLGLLILLLAGFGMSRLRRG
ncbi:MAG: IPTL-CTERM sorting domain-containing protein [Acidobacteriota bacterium]